MSQSTPTSKKDVGRALKAALRELDGERIVPVFVKELTVKVERPVRYTNNRDDWTKARIRMTDAVGKVFYTKTVPNDTREIGKALLEAWCEGRRLEKEKESANQKIVSLH